MVSIGFAVLVWMAVAGFFISRRNPANPEAPEAWEIALSTAGFVGLGWAIATGGLWGHGW